MAPAPAPIAVLRSRLDQFEQPLSATTKVVANTAAVRRFIVVVINFSLIVITEVTF
jgi:hypothetical protein